HQQIEFATSKLHKVSDHADGTERISRAASRFSSRPAELGLLGHSRYEQEACPNLEDPKRLDASPGKLWNFGHLMSAGIVRIICRSGTNIRVFCGPRARLT
ncbi:MAG: hypothetical protein ACLQJ0_12510, partial [Steroidobacteraceae bacterium]